MIKNKRYNIPQTMKLLGNNYDYNYYSLMADWPVSLKSIDYSLRLDRAPIV